MGPFLTMELRVSIAAIILLLYAFATKTKLNLKEYWKQYLIIGAINAAIPFYLIAFAELHLTASISSILNSLTPLFTALIVWVWFGEKLTILKCFGLIFGWKNPSL